MIRLSEREAEELFRLIKRPMPRTQAQIDRIAINAVRKALRIRREK